VIRETLRGAAPRSRRSPLKRARRDLRASRQRRREVSTEPGSPRSAPRFRLRTLRPPCRRTDAYARQFSSKLPPNMYPPTRPWRDGVERTWPRTTLERSRPEPWSRRRPRGRASIRRGRDSSIRFSWRETFSAVSVSFGGFLLRSVQRAPPPDKRILHQVGPRDGRTSPFARHMAQSLPTRM